MYYRRLAVAFGEKLQGKNGFAAAEIRIDIMRNEAGFKVAGIAHSLCRPAGYVQVFRHNKLDALDQYVAASGEAVRRDRYRFHTPLVFHAVFVNLGKDCGKGDPPAGADVFHGNVHLDDPAKGFQVRVSHIHKHGIGAPFNCQIYRGGACFRIDNDVAFHRDGRIREDYKVPLGVGILDGFVYKLSTGVCADMTDKKFQCSAFRSGDAQRGDRSAQRSGTEHRRGTGVGVENAGDNKIGVYNFVDNNICRAGFGNIGGKLGK